MIVYDRAKAARREPQIYFHPKDMDLPQAKRRVILRDGSYARCFVVPFKMLTIFKQLIDDIQMDEDEAPQ